MSTKRSAPDCVSESSKAKTPRSWEQQGEDPDTVDWFAAEQLVPPQPWEARNPLAFLPEESLPTGYVDVVREGGHWIGMDGEAVSAVARTPSYPKVNAVLATHREGPDALGVVDGAMDGVIEQEPSLIRCDDIGPLEDGWVFAVALWPGGRFYLIIACGPSHEFGWFVIPAVH
jgi:hypothetical protein